MEAVASKPIKRTSKILEPDEEKIPQPADVALGLGDTPFVRPAPLELSVAEAPLPKSYEEALAFNEEPVTIMVNPSDNPEAALYIEAWVNGKGTERYLEGIGWAEVKFIPVGEEVIVKRKYLEVWLRSKTMGVHTPQEMADGNEPTNPLKRTFSRTHSISILEDRNPRGREWARQLMRLAA